MRMMTASKFTTNEEKKERESGIIEREGKIK